MPNHPISFLYRRDWPDDESDYEDNLDNGFDNDFGHDQVMDGFFGGGCNKPPEKKPECGEPPKNPPSSEPQKPESGKSCKCKPKKRSSSRKSSCKRSIRKSKSRCKKKSSRRAAKKMKRDKCGGGRSSRMRLSRNPFIIFFLLMLQKQANKRAADVAREAGKQWCCMDAKSKETFQKLAQKERMRRKMAGKGKKSKHGSKHGCVAKRPKARAC